MFESQYEGGEGPIQSFRKQGLSSLVPRPPPSFSLLACSDEQLDRLILLGMRQTGCTGVCLCNQRFHKQYTPRLVALFVMWRIMQTSDDLFRVRFLPPVWNRGQSHTYTFLCERVSLVTAPVVQLHAMWYHHQYCV